MTDKKSLDKELIDSMERDAKTYLGFLFVTLTLTNAVVCSFLPMWMLYKNMLATYPYMFRLEVAGLIFPVFITTTMGGVIMLWLAMFIWSSEHQKMVDMRKRIDDGTW